MTTSIWYSSLGTAKNEYPLVRSHEAREYAEIDFGEPIMEFRLIYEGPLLAERTDAKDSRLVHKFEIRRKLHRQLAELWRTHPILNRISTHVLPMQNPDTQEYFRDTRINLLAKKYPRRGMEFVPLISTHYGLVCSLNILFLRRDSKGGLIQTGDLDNRIKLLFDALKIPSEKEIPDSIVVSSEPKPFLCLMEDDSLITDFRVTADRLLVPEGDVGSELVETSAGDKGAEVTGSKVCLIIEVKTMVADQARAHFELGPYI